MAEIYYTVTGAGAGTAAGWSDAGSVGALDTYLTSSAVAGDRVWVMGSSTYTFSFFSSQDGVSGDPIRVIGVATGTTAEPPTQSDWAIGSDRPTFATGSGNATGDDYWEWYNIIGTGTGSQVFRSDADSKFFNCKATNTSGTGGRDAFIQAGFSSCLFVACEAESTNGNAINAFSNTTIRNCYIHDSSQGITLAGTYNVQNTIIDTCTTGIDLSTHSRSVLVWVTFYNCTSGIIGTTSSGNYIESCAFDSCTDAWKFNNSGTVTVNHFDYNNWATNNTRDMSWDNGSTEDNSAKGLNATASVSGFTDPANGDFSLGGSSAMLEAGKPLDVGVG